MDVKTRFSEEQIIGFVREADKDIAVKELCRKHGFSEASYYLWRSKFDGMDVSDAKRRKALEAENARLKKLLAEAMLENEVGRGVAWREAPRKPNQNAYVTSFNGWLRDECLNEHWFTSLAHARTV